MKKLLTLFATTAIVSMASLGYAADATSKTEYDSKKNGGYESSSSSEHTTASGTANASDKEVEVDVDGDGSTTKTIKAKTTSDPKGLLNKKKATDEVVIEKNADGSYERKAESNATDASGTNTSVDQKTEVDVDSDGNIKSTSKTTKVVDPKGLLNKHKETTKVETLNGEVIEHEKDAD